ncbi:hypothetical protein [Heyndrickxia oleronia]|uniref:hypothetical protein n=1 Tax=Heyndrickxia oleronia TaxID=38875 RepID=UPI001B13B58A|nr:hypothetical protein [Heyndrickxia oleronia]GIN37792.1 hypothetical protein J19TS1_07410 [Heyndrickxia oleronia]
MKALFALIDGLKLKDPYTQLRLSLDTEYLIIEERAFKVFRPVTEATYKVPLKNIIATIATTEKELVDKNKSAIGRGVAGGLLFGPAGLILGGLSGVGTKKGLQSNHLFIISYLSSKGEIENITLNTHKVSNAQVTNKFQRYVQKELKRIQPSEKVAEIRKQNELNEAETESSFIL